MVGAIAKAVSVFGGEQLELEVYERELAAGKAVLVVGVEAEGRSRPSGWWHPLHGDWPAPGWVATNLLYHGDGGRSSRWVIRRPGKAVLTQGYD